MVSSGAETRRGRLQSLCNAAIGLGPDWAIFADWLDGVEELGFDLLALAAVGMIARSFSLLPTNEIARYSRPVLQPALAWIMAANVDNAKACGEVLPRVDQLAGLAERASTQRGDYWTHAAVEMIGLLPAAIAIQSGVNVPESLIPLNRVGLPAAGMLQELIGYFARFPSHVTRTPSEAATAMAIVLAEADLAPGARFAEIAAVLG